MEPAEKSQLCPCIKKPYAPLSNVSALYSPTGKVASLEATGMLGDSFREEYIIKDVRIPSLRLWERK
jgi:hypothetical protein